MHWAPAMRCRTFDSDRISQAVSELKVFGVAMTCQCLTTSVAPPATARRLCALRVLDPRGMRDAALQAVYWSVVYAKLRSQCLVGLHQPDRPAARRHLHTPQQTMWSLPTRPSTSRRAVQGRGQARRQNHRKQYSDSIPIPPPPSIA
jgi:hypothetical protein